MPANSHVSPVLSYWHDPRSTSSRPASPRPRRSCRTPATALVGGKLYYPAGKQEKLTTE